MSELNKAEDIFGSFTKDPIDAKKLEQILKVIIQDLPTDLMEHIKNKCEETAQETKEQTREEFATWVSHFTNIFSFFISLVGEFIAKKQVDKMQNSLLMYRTAGLMNHIPWIWISVQYGAYHQAIRELRYLFESVVQAFYLDEEHSDANIICKLELIKEIEKPQYRLYGIRLIDELSLDNKQELKILYSDLSKYVHCSYDELKSLLEQGQLKQIVMFEFQKELFTECLTLTNRTLDAVYFILLNEFPNLKNELKRYKEINKYFKKLQCELTAKFLKK